TRSKRSGAMQLAPGKPQFVRRPIHQLGNFAVDLGYIRAARSVGSSCGFDREWATARQSVGEPRRRGLAVSYARRLGDAVDAAAFLFGRSDGEAELLLQGPREDTAHSV